MMFNLASLKNLVGAIFLLLLCESQILILCLEFDNNKDDKNKLLVTFWPLFWCSNFLYKKIYNLKNNSKSKDELENDDDL